MLDESRKAAHAALALVGRVALHQVPLVDREDARFVFLGNVVGKLLVQTCDPLGGVDEQKDPIGAPYRPLRPMERIEVEAVADLRLALDPRGVDRQKRKSVEV